jgi:hypothetical protein
MEQRKKSLNMGSIFDNTKENIDLFVENKIGNYALGYIDKNGVFIPKYVGRGKVQSRLIKHLIDDEYTEQPFFKFSYAKNETEARIKECQNFHDFKDQLLNKEHPKLPNGEKCHFCLHVGDDDT